MLAPAEGAIGNRRSKMGKRGREEQEGVTWRAAAAAGAAEGARGGGEPSVEERAVREGPVRRLFPPPRLLNEQKEGMERGASQKRYGIEEGQGEEKET